MRDAPLDLELRIRRRSKEARERANGRGLFGGGIGAGATSHARRWTTGLAARPGACAGTPAPVGIRPRVVRIPARTIDGSGTRGGEPRGADPRDASRDPHAPGFVVQRYLDRPHLGRFEFDLRLYVLVLGTEGFPAFLSKEGLARFCTAPYASPSRANRDAERSFLTNYALNKKSEAFARSNAVDGGDGSKRSVASVMSELAEEGADVDALWRRVETLVASTVAAMRHALVDAATNARVDPETCFQVFGFDVILDESLKPHLLEVNAGPSLAMDAVVPVDGGKETERGRNKEPGPGSIAAFQSKALRFCAALDVVPAPCYCKDHAGAHAHEFPAVDAHVRSAALAGALEIVRLRATRNARRRREGRNIASRVRRVQTRGESRRVVDRQRRRGTTEEDGVDGDEDVDVAEEPGPSTRERERVEEDVDEPEPRIESREETESTETTGTTESETGPAAGLRLASVAGSIPGGDGRRRRARCRVDRASDEDAGASLDALLERARRASARARGGHARRLLDVASRVLVQQSSQIGVSVPETVPRRRRVQGAQQQRARHSSSAVARQTKSRGYRFRTFSRPRHRARGEVPRATRRRRRRARHARHLRRRALRRPRPATVI